MGWHCYQIYGLPLRSSRPIAGLIAAEHRADDAEFDLAVDLDGGWPQAVPTAAEADWTLTFPHAGEDPNGLLVWRLVTASGAFTRLQFAVSAGRIDFVIDPAARRIWAQWSGAVTVDDVAAVLLGPGLGCVLRLRGVTCLHASVVARGDRAAALIGPNGRGKSTTAAALTRHGLVVLSDDIAALSETGGRFWVQPGYPRLRITPRVAQLVHETPDALVPVLSFDDKRYIELDADDADLRWRFSPRPLPLEVIYCLGKRNPPEEKPGMHFVPFAERLPMLAWHSYVNYILDRPLRVREFELLGRLVENVPVRRVSFANDLEALPEVCALIAADFEQLVAA